MKTELDRIFKRVAIIGIMLISIGGCGSLTENVEKFTSAFFPPRELGFTVVVPAKYPESSNIKSIQVNVFSMGTRSNYADQLKEMIEAGIANEGALTVVSQNADSVVSGNINFGKIDKVHSKDPVQSDKGMSYIYHYKKRLPITGSFSLADQRRRTLCGDSLDQYFEDKWTSYQSKDDALFKAASDEEFIAAALRQVAQKVVFAVSPHKETVKRELEVGSDENIKLGNKYLVNGRADDALEIWDKVAQQTAEPKDKASAYYNMGVVKETQGKNQEAFDLFKKANELFRERTLYIQAMTRVEDAKKQKEKAESQLRPTQESQPSIQQSDDSESSDQKAKPSKKSKKSKKKSKKKSGDDEE